MGRFRGRLLDDGFELRVGVRLATMLSAMMLSAPVLADAPTPPPPASAPPAARAPDEQKQRVQRAQELVDEALGLYERGEYRAAIAKLTAAVELDPKGAELVYNLGLIHERLGELEIAEMYYRKDLELETDPKLRERAQGILKRLSGAKKELAPKEASSSAPSPGAPSPPIAPRRLGPGVIVAGSVAATALCIGAGFGISALVMNPGASAKTGPLVSVSDLYAEAHEAHQRAIIADISFVLGAAAGLTALLLYASPAPPSPRHAGRSVNLELGAGRAVLAGVF